MTEIADEYLLHNCYEYVNIITQMCMEYKTKPDARASRFRQIFHFPAVIYPHRA